MIAVGAAAEIIKARAKRKRSSLQKTMSELSYSDVRLLHRRMALHFNLTQYNVVLTQGRFG